MRTFGKTLLLGALLFAGPSFAEDASVRYDMFVAGGTLDAVRTAVRARAGGESVFLAAPRPYCGEDRAATLDLTRHPDDDADDPLVREIFNPDYRAGGAYKVLPAKGWRAVQRFEPYVTVETAAATGGLDTVTTPLLVKRACDRALLKAKVEYLTAASVVSARREPAGDWLVTYVSRSGERTVRAGEFVDRRMSRRVTEGRHRFSIRTVRGPQPHIETLSFDFDVPVDGALGMVAAENHARSLVDPTNLLDVAEWAVCEDAGAAGPEPIRDGDGLPVLATCDVAVAGGGTGGGPAAVAAARSGARTILVEYQNVLGGVVSEGRIGGYGSYYDGNVCGYTKELEWTEGVFGRDAKCVYFFARSESLRREIVRRGGEVWLGTMVAGAQTDGGRLTGVIVVLPDGTRGVIRCKAAVDATGNSDLAAAAGAETEFISADELSLQGCGMAGQPLNAASVNSDIGFVDETDAADLCFFAIRSRQSLPDRIWNQSSLVDSRERRRILGDFRISPIDLFLGRRYPDVVCTARSSFDTHGQTVHPIFFIRDTGHHGAFVTANVPYRALLPRGVEGVLVTGLGISAHRDAMPVLRMKADIQNQGYAVGLAAAMAVADGVTPRRLDIRRLQRRLVEIGNLSPDALTWQDTLPLSDEALAAAVRRIPNGYDALPEVMSDPSRAIPFLRRETAFECLHVRALLGDPSAAAGMVGRLQGLSWDEGWNYKGMGQYHRSVGTVDRYVIALGNTKAKEALPVLDRLAAELTGASEYSHFRALALAYESIGDRRGTVALARLLALEGVGGHALGPGEVPPVPGYEDRMADAERSDCLRELCVARALYRLGDKDGLGLRTLKSYLSDPRRAYASHVRKVLTASVRADCRNGDWQNAIDAAARRGGGTVEVPAGIWFSPPLELKSGVTLRLAKGAVLRADVGNPDYSNRVVSAFIRAQGASNVSLVGEGIVEGGGAAFAPKSRRPHLVDFRECRNVLIEGVTLRDGASWTLFPCSCTGVTIRGVRIVSHVNHNNDGIDVASSNVLIEDCDIDSGDDALVFKTPDSRMVLENIRVRNCRLASGCNAIKFGTESKGIVRHVTIEGCRVEPPSVPSVYAEKWLKAIPGCQTRFAGISGIALECVDGGSLESVTVRDVTVRGVQTPVFVRLGSRRPALPGRRSYLRDVLIENVEGVASSRIACSITGVEGLRPAGITVRNCRFEFPGGGTAADATSRIPEKADKYPESSMFNRLPLPAYGFYVRHADGVRLENVELSLARGATDARPPVKAEDADVRVLDSTVRTQVVEGAPFPLSVEVADIPTREFRIDAYGARPGDRPVTEAIARTVEACVKAGGGRVVVPAGRWVTGPVFLACNVDLHLAEGAVLHFPDDPAMHPVVKDISRGLRDRPAAHVYAVGCTNVAVTGKGTIESAVGYWHKNLKKTLRPQTLFFGHCKRVRLEGFRIRGSASWTIHVFATDDVVVRSIDSLCHGPNTDGLDLDSVGRALVEDCRFDQGDDGFCIKSGINQEGRERGLPSHDIVIRRCAVVNGHTLLGIGSELSGGIRNVFMTDCTVENDAWRFLRVKTNPDRGGFVENVYLQNVSGKKAAHAVFQLETDYYWKPSPGKTAHHTRIKGVHLSNVTAEESPFGVRLEGSPEMPPEDITVENLAVGRVKKELERVRNVRGYVWKDRPASGTSTRKQGGKQ